MTAPSSGLRRYQAVRWDEPNVLDLGSPGQRGLALPPTEDVVAAAGGRAADAIPIALRRATPPRLPELSQPEVLRHFLRLSQMTLGDALIADTLGTCTMKYSPVVDEAIANAPQMTELHPAQDPATIQGLLELVHRFEGLLREISGFDAFSFQGGAGQPGIFTSALIIRAFHTANGELDRRREVITTSYSHPANAAAAAVAGFHVVSLMPGERGYPDLDAFRAALSDRTAGLMITNPEDTGIFNPHIGEFVRLVHEAGGLCAYDQANGNPLLGVARARDQGFDLGQFNLHKTFGAPHNATGPGAAAVGVRADLERFLPVPVVVRDAKRYTLETDRPDSVGRVRSWAGNLQVVVRAYAWVMSLGAAGLRTVAETAVLNNNYLASRLAAIDGLTVPYAGSGPRLEQIRYSWAELAEATGVTSEDILRRTADYGIQPYFTSHVPMLVPEPMTLEPTELVSKADLDELAAILAAIADEARATPDVVRSAPHRAPVGPLDEAAANDPERLGTDVAPAPRSTGGGEQVSAMVIFPLGGVAITTEYFEQPDLDTNLPDHEESGARVEIRGWTGSGLTDYLWRADCFRLQPGPEGNFARAHYHTQFVGDYGDPRLWDPDLEADPVAWVMDRLTRLPEVLRELGADRAAGSINADELRALLPIVQTAVARSMDGPAPS